MVLRRICRLLVAALPAAIALRPQLSWRQPRRTTARAMPDFLGPEDIENLPDLGELSDASCPPKKHKDPAPADDKPLPDRFLVAARALRGEFDPEDEESNTDEGNALLGAIIEEFPAPFHFTAVGRAGDEAWWTDNGADGLVDGLTRAVSKATGEHVRAEVTPRLNGRFASVRLTTLVESPEMIESVFETLRAHESVKMAF
mmetsp:Transcript_10689/g.31873  ORF Transcript_10689/g.31873 Transcript_10689/m.31873 type:complete len:201 (-) Transcript_10689:95-697(-)